jgi:hypothetical protein
MSRLHSLLCRIQSVWGTVTMPEFWHSIIRPPLVVFSGHVWPTETAWSELLPSPHPEDWPGFVEFDVSRCLRCGHIETPAPWRRYYGPPNVSGWSAPVGTSLAQPLGTAATAPAAPEATPEVSTPLRVPLSVPGTGEAAASSYPFWAARSPYASLTGVRVHNEPSTSIAMPSPDSPTRAADSSGSR